MLSTSLEYGGSNNPCDDNYSGPQGFSERETSNIRKLLARLHGRTALYLSLHSYGQLFLYPWGYDPHAVLEDEDDLVSHPRQDQSHQHHRHYNHQ